MAYDQSKIVTVGGLKKLSVKVKSTQDVLSKCIFLGNSENATIVDDVTTTQSNSTDENNIAVMLANAGSVATMLRAVDDSSSQSNLITNDNLTYENCNYVDGGISYITDNVVVLNLRITTTVESNRFFVIGLPAPKNVNNSLAYVPVSIFCAPSVYSGGYVQINSNTNQGELVLSFSSNLPVGTDIMIGATYVS